MRKIIFLLIVLSFVIAGCRALAEENLPDPGTLPDSTFYFLKSWKESIQTFFTFGAENKVKQYLHLAEVRLAEYQKMIEKGKTEIAQKTLDKYEKRLNHATQKIEELENKGKDVKNISKELLDITSKHINILERNLQKVPETGKEGIKKALDAAKKEKDSAVTKPASEIIEKDTLVISDDLWFDGEIVKIKNNFYRMYFEEKGVVYSAISSDGINWTQEAGSRVEGTMPALLELPNRRTRIYYQRIIDGKEVFLSAISEDGLNFQKEEGVRLSAGDAYDSLGIKVPNIIKLPNGGYRMYYAGKFSEPRAPEGFKEMILSAYSDDGLNFRKEEGSRINSESIHSGALWSPYVIYENDSYVMYFTAGTRDLLKSGIYTANSKDGLSFDIPTLIVGRDPSLGNQLIKNEFGGVLGAPEDPFILKSDSRKFLYYWIGGKGIFLKILPV